MFLLVVCTAISSSRQYHCVDLYPRAPPPIPLSVICQCLCVLSVTPLFASVPQGPCCNDTCEFGYGQECRNDNGCRAKARCNGRSAECPPSIQKPDRTICNEGNVCFKGVSYSSLPHSHALTFTIAYLSVMFCPVYNH